MRQFKYAVFPTSAVTFLDADISKNGPLSRALPWMKLLFDESVLKFSSDAVCWCCFVFVEYKRKSSFCVSYKDDVEKTPTIEKKKKI